MGLRSWLTKKLEQKTNKRFDELKSENAELKHKILQLIERTTEKPKIHFNVDARLEKKYSYNEFQKYCVENNITLSKTTSLVGDVVLEKNVTIDEYSYVSYRSIIFQDTKIGKYCSISFSVYIGVTSHPTNWLSTHPFQYAWHNQIEYNKSKETLIGNDVWIGANAIIQTGIIIGDGAIIGSGAIVNKNVPPYAVVVGVPAKIIKYRFDESTIKELLELKWWDIDADVLLKANVDFNNILEAIEKVKKIKMNYGD